MRAGVRRLAIVPALALATLGFSCVQEPTAPGPLAGAYVLSSVAGQPLPVLVREERATHPSGMMGTRREHLEAMRLAIAPAAVDTFSMVRRVTWDLDTGDDPSPQQVAEGMTTESTDDRFCVRFGRFDDPGFDCEGGPVMRPRGNGFAVQLAPGPYPVDTRVEYVFVRQP